MKQAQAQARQMISDSEIYRQAQEEANAMLQAAKQESGETVQAAQDKIRELKVVTNSYVDDALRQTEQAISEALNEVRESRAKFNALVGSQSKTPAPASNPAIIEDIE